MGEICQKEYNIQENADKLCRDLICEIDSCLSVFDSDGKREAKAFVLWIYLHELSLIVNSEENTSEVWKAVERWRMKDFIRNLKKIKRGARKMPFVQKRMEGMIEDIKKKRGGD